MTDKLCKKKARATDGLLHEVADIHFDVSRAAEAAAAIIMGSPHRCERNVGLAPEFPEKMDSGLFRICLLMLSQRENVEVRIDPSRCHPVYVGSVLLSP